MARREGMLAFALISAPARRQPDGLSAQFPHSRRVSGANIYFYLYSIIVGILSFDMMTVKLNTSEFYQQIKSLKYEKHCKIIQPS